MLGQQLQMAQAAEPKQQAAVLPREIMAPIVVSYLVIYLKYKISWLLCSELFVSYSEFQGQVSTKFTVISLIVKPQCFKFGNKNNMKQELQE